KVKSGLIGAYSTCTPSTSSTNIPEKEVLLQDLLELPLNILLILNHRSQEYLQKKNWNAMMERELGEGYSFTKKKCFICGSLSHLIKDYDYYEKKKAREAEDKRVVNISNGMTKPVWTNANREHPLKNMVDRVIFDSGCSGHMTGNKDQLEDFEEFNGGSVTFRGSKGYICGIAWMCR
ncbi:hypothetical protein Tco_0862673, partial [Tanacetum coccineum]